MNIGVTSVVMSSWLLKMLTEMVGIPANEFL